VSVKQKKINEDERFKRELDRIRDEEDYLKSKNAVAMKLDIAERFGEYNKDPSIGGMYQRKKKIKKTKSKRKCRCK